MNKVAFRQTLGNVSNDFTTTHKEVILELSTTRRYATLPVISAKAGIQDKNNYALPFELRVRGKITAD